MKDLGKYVLGLWIFLLAAAVGLSLFLGSDILDENEARNGVICREMIHSGDYLRTTVNGEAVSSPGGIYHLFLATSSLIGGGKVNTWTLRLPGIIAALAALAGLGYLGRKWFDRKSGICAMYMLLGCCLFIYRARNGSPDIFRFAGVILALGWFTKHVEGQNKFGGYLGMHIIAFLTAQAYGVSELLIPYVAILPFTIRDGGYKKHLNWHNLLAFLLTGLIFGLILYFVYLYSLPGDPTPFPGGIWYNGDLSGQNNRSKLLSLALIPWGPLLLVALIGMIGNWQKLSNRLKDLIFSAGLLAILFAMSGFRSAFLLLLILGLWSFATATVITGEGGFFIGKTEQGYRYFLVFLGSLVALNIVLLPLRVRVFPLDVPLSFTLLLPLVGLLALIIFIFDEYHNGELFEKYFYLPPKFGAVIFGSMLFSLSFFGVLLPPWELQRSECVFLSKIATHLEKMPGRQIGYFGEDLSSQFLFYANLSEPMEFCRNLEEVKKFLESNQGANVVLASKTSADLTELSQMLAQFSGELPPDAESQVAVLPPTWQETPQKWEFQRKENFVVWELELAEQ